MVRITALLGTLSLLAAGCQKVEGPDVVLITLDTTRADRLGAMGDLDARTPALDALASRGAVFERAFSSVPLTLPAHTSILTGLGPNLHGVHDNGRFVVPESLETVPERLASRGYDTGAFVSAFVLDSGFGLDRGFDVYDDSVEDQRDPLSFEVTSRPGEETTERALAWLAARGERPWFLWVHYYDAHQPLDPPAPFDEIADPYAGAIAYMDSQVARLLEGVERAAAGRETLVIAVADHGESLGEHDENSHGTVAYDSTLHVPLIAAGPGFEAGTRSAAFARIEDVAPTILAAAGLSLPEQGGGIPLPRLLAGAADAERVSWFECLGPSYGLGWARLAGVRSDRWKLTAEPDPPELYDVLEDPGESRNRAGDEPEVMARLLAAYTERAEAPEMARQPEELSPEVEELLARLGYLNAPQGFGPGEAPDPRKAVAALGLVFAAQGLAQDGRVGDSIEALQILAHSPVVRAMALRYLARIYAVAGMTSDAVTAYQALVGMTGSLTARVGLARALVAAGQPEDALATLDALGSDPEALPPLVALTRAGALLALDRSDEAEAAANGVLAHDPANDGALALRSRARAAREGPAAEIVRLEALLADPPAPRERLVDVQELLADLLRSQGRIAEARALLEADGGPDPRHLRQLAQLAVEAGDLEQAVSLYQDHIARSPASLGARRDLAELYGRMGRVDDQLAVYSDLLAIDRTDATLLVDRGVAFFGADRREEALQDFRAATIADAELPEAQFNLGLVQLESGQEEEAEAHLLRAVELRPDYAKAHFHLARIYRRRGDPRAAEHAEQAVRATSPVASGPPSGER